MLRSRPILFYLAVGLLLLGVFMEEAEARRKILRGRKSITRQYYRKPFLPAWAFSVIGGLCMMLVGGGLFIGLKRFLIDSVSTTDIPSYQPAMQDDS